MSAALRPLRLLPGTDLRRELEAWAAVEMPEGGFVVAGVGSLVDVRLRFAGRPDEAVIEGPLEMLTLAGTVTPAGAHLHAAVANPAGRVFGGHLGYGSEVRTTAEVLMIPATGWQLSRDLDPATGYRELVVRPLVQSR